MRYTEYHCGVAVIKDRALLPQAMEKLAKYEDVEEERKTERLSLEEYIMERFVTGNDEKQEER